AIDFLLSLFYYCIKLTNVVAGSTLDTHTLVERVGFPFFSTNGTRGTCP
ncbi:unnamed protein product, partial [marine sediment metagenome]